MAEIKVHPFDTNSDEIEALKVKTKINSQFYKCLINKQSDAASRPLSTYPRLVQLYFKFPIRFKI